METQHEEVVRAYLDAVGASGVVADRGEGSLSLVGRVGERPLRVRVLGTPGAEVPMPVVRGSVGWPGVLRPFAVRIDVGEVDGDADATAALQRGAALWQARVGPAGRSAVLLTAPPFEVLGARAMWAFRHWAGPLAGPDVEGARRAVARVALRASGTSPALRLFSAAPFRALSSMVGADRERPAEPVGPVADAVRRSGLFEDLGDGPRRRAGPWLSTRSMQARSDRLGLRLRADRTALRPLPAAVAPAETRLVPATWTTVRLTADRPGRLLPLARLATVEDEHALWWWLHDEQAEAPRFAEALAEIAAHLETGRDGPYR